MMRRLIILTTLFVLFGVLVLSVPVMAGGSAQSGKASVVIKTEVAKPAVAQHQVSSFRSVIVQTLRFQLARWLGIVVGAGNGQDLPQKDSHDHSRGFEPYIMLKDDGGCSVDI